MRDLLKWGAAEPVPRNAPAMVTRMFLTRKSDGRTARPILDARPQNSLLHREALERPRFRLLSPPGHIRVGTGVGMAAPISLYEADATSFFPSFVWAEELGRAFKQLV